MPAHRGFTLIELIVVMVIIGVLSTLAMARFTGRQPFDEAGYAQEVAAAARYAQKLALSTRCPVRFRLDDEGGYRLTRPDGFVAGICAANFAADVINPATGEAPYAGSAPNGVAVDASSGLPATYDYDAQGGAEQASGISIQIGTFHVLLPARGGQVTVQ